MEQVEQRLSLFRELLSSVNPHLVLVELDSHFDMIHSNAPDHDIWSLFFRFVNQPGYQTEEVVLPNDLFETVAVPVAPWVFTNPIGMTWMSECEVTEGRIVRVVVLGPLFLDDFEPKNIEEKLLQHHLSASLIRPFMETVRRMPVISLNRMYEYGLMLHRCLTGKNCTISDFIYPDLALCPGEEESKREHLGGYMAEAELMRIVEDGNIQYEKEQRSTLSLTGNIDRKIGGDGSYLRQAKNTVIIFITLCSRAAIRGGLSPEIAYHMSDQYVSITEKAENLGKVVEISRKMFDDFVRRVHRVKIHEGSGVSPQISDACNYISLHILDRIDIHSLAARAGYADYYFSAKFKKETGKSVRDYVMEQKLNKAQELLGDTTQDIGDIAMRLGFESHSHLSDVFKRHTGMSPSKWRAAYKHAGDTE